MQISELLDAARRRWPPAARLFFALSLALGIGAFTLMSGYRHRIEALRPDLGPPTAVVVAAHDLARGVELGASDILVRTLPAQVVPPGALTDVSQGAGRVLLAGIDAGETLTQTRLAAKGSGPVAALVPAGFKAIVVPSNLPADAVRPGDTVDILTTFGGAHAHTESTASGVQVLSVLASGPAMSTDVGAPAGPQLVLLVDAATASSLAYATAFGHIVVAVDPPEVTGSQETGLSVPSSGG